MTGDRQNEPTAPVHPGGERWIVDGGDGCTTEFDTEAEAVAYADACIQDWCDEGWMEEVDNIFVARLTHRSQRQVVAVQGEVSDEEWERVTHGESGYSEWWEYTIEPVGSTPQAPTVDSVPEADEPDTMTTILPTGWKATEFSDDTEWPWWDEGGDAITWLATVHHWPGEYEHWTWELVSPDCEADTYLLSGCEQQDPTPFLRDVVDRLHASAPIDLARSAAAGVSSDR